MQQGAPPPQSRRVGNVFSIPPDVRFLPTLVDHILNGTLLPPDFDLAAPFGHADITIYLPTQRSVRLLEAAFLSRAGNSSLILPRILALGDVDEDEPYFTESAFDQPGEAIPPAITPVQRQLILTRLILQWGARMEAMASATRERDEPLLVPASAADAAWLAADLGDLLDRASTEGVGWHGLSGLVAEKDLAAFWQMSVQFLEIVTLHWPRILAAAGRVDVAVRRDLLIAAEAKRLSSRSGPVIAAGSTGTLPATARFLATVAHHPKGALVLPGLDLAMNEDAYAAIGGPENRTHAETGHPQYGLKQLLSGFLKTDRLSVIELGRRDPDRARRSTIISKAMVPAAVTDQWAAFRAEVADDEIARAFCDVALIDANSDSEEALAIAAALRDFVEEPRGLACLVTPDRVLARRVALELRRFALAVDDSAGRPLAKTGPAIVARLIVDCIAGNFEPTTFLALLKHPLATFGLEPGFVRRAARVLDLAVLRGPRLAGGIAGLRRQLSRVVSDITRGLAATTDVTGDLPVDALAGPSAEMKSRDAGRLHPAIARYTMEDWDAADALLVRLETVFHGLEKRMLDQDAPDIAGIAQSHLECWRATLPAVAQSGPAATALLRLFEDMTAENGTAFAVSLKDYPALFQALLGVQTVRAQSEQDPRILILGALEARLIDPDLIILAALDEGAWPKQAEADAFMSRSMRAAMGFEAPERRIGLAAHDVCQGLGVSRVILSRAAKRDGTPTVMSRWLQRLLAITGAETASAMAWRGNRYLSRARAFDRPLSPVVVTPNRPNPTPPVSARPKGLSVTQVETWVRDPYAIYANRILGLKRIDPLGEIPDFASRGTLVHEVMDRFNQHWNGVVDEAAHALLLRLGRELFDHEMADFPDQLALWWPRFERIAQSYLTWEKQRDVAPLVRHSEIDTRCPIPVDGADFTLSGKIDRIDELADGTLAIIDFKTGTIPTPKQVKSGLNAQLALEVLLNQKGAFDFRAPLSARATSVLGWVKLDGASDQAGFASAIEKKDKDTTPDDLGRLAGEQLLGLIRAYRKRDQGYMSRPRPDFQARYVGDYDHLARLREWQMADQEGEE